MEKQNNNLPRNFYKWHRILGLIALIPIIGWTLSGLSHPLMSNWLRPAIPEETFSLFPQSKLNPQLTLQQVLDKHHINGVRNFDLVKFNGKTYYQVLLKDSTNSYFSANDAQLLPGGDTAYAQYLARYFTQDSVSKIKSIRLQTRFDSHYQPINRLLPVWKVSLDRADGMDIYVETGQSRLATFNNNTRKNLLWFFEQLHTWGFVANAFGDRFRSVLMIGVVGILFLSMLSGLIIYGLFWKRFKAITQGHKDKQANEKRLIHRYHRQLGLIMSFFMLMFFLSAGFHLIVKLRSIAPAEKQYAQLINRDDLKADNLHLPIADSLIIKRSLVKFNGQTYYRLMTTKKEIIYINTQDTTTLQNGDVVFATYLANYYRHNTSAVVASKPIRQFTNEYGFINKRLPVMQISFKNNDNWYVETSTQKLATHVAGIDRAEGLSFIFLHKFFWMTWAGKDVRDVISMLAALAILTVSLLGLAAFIKNK